MSNRYLDEDGVAKMIEKLEATSNQINTTIKDRTDALGFFKLMGIKEITTARQKKNGTTVYELPIRRLSYTGNSTTYRYAIYDSGYIRDVSDYNASPWYINKRYETNEMYWNSYYKKYTKYKTSKAAFINNFDDQLVYLANYILKNRYRNKLYSCCDWGIEQIREQRKFMHDAKWEGNTVTIPRDEYNELKKANPLATNKVEITMEQYNEYMDIKHGKCPNDIQVIINGTRYNLS